MSLQKKQKKILKSKILNDPHTFYGNAEENKTIQFFSSFEEESIFNAKESASLSYDKRLSNVEVLRKMVFYKFLLPDGKWQPIANVFKVMPPYTNEASQ